MLKRFGVADREHGSEQNKNNTRNSVEYSKLYSVVTGKVAPGSNVDTILSEIREILVNGGGANAKSENSADYDVFEYFKNKIAGGTQPYEKPRNLLPLYDTCLRVNRYQPRIRTGKVIRQLEDRVKERRGIT